MSEPKQGADQTSEQFVEESLRRARLAPGRVLTPDEKLALVARSQTELAEAQTICAEQTSAAVESIASHVKQLHR
jgi:hypothetical protein